VFANLTIQFNLVKFSMKDLFRIVRLHFSPRMMYLDLYDAFGTDTFDNLYTVYEKDTSIPKKTVKAQELILSLLKERAETGRIYIMNIDHCNSHSSYKDQITMSKPLPRDHRTHNTNPTY
jgi:ribonucleotide reductase alpha subunit